MDIEQNRTRNKKRKEKKVKGKNLYQGYLAKIKGNGVVESKPRVRCRGKEKKTAT